MADLPEWATLAEIGDGLWRLDLDGALNGTRIKGHATGSSPEAMRKLVDGIADVAAAQSAEALAARLPSGLPLTALPLTWHVTRPLAQAGIAVVGDLAGRTDEQLLALSGFGPNRLTALKDALTGGAP